MERILKINEGNHNIDISTMETKIDLHVYRLYGLTYDEVIIVAPETPITREEYEKEQK